MWDSKRVKQTTAILAATAVVLIAFVNLDCLHNDAERSTRKALMGSKRETANGSTTPPHLHQRTEGNEEEVPSVSSHFALHSIDPLENGENEEMRSVPYDVGMAVVGERSRRGQNDVKNTKEQEVPTNQQPALTTKSKAASRTSGSGSNTRGGDSNKVQQPKKKKIKQISVIGERNSGTTWTSEHLHDCFGHKIPVLNRLVRYKHWFQHDVVPDKRADQTLVVAQFRNPYHWIEGMMAKPHHAPMHNPAQTPDWKTFVTTPWTMPRTELDLELLHANGTYDEETGRIDTSNITCKAYFDYHQINSCLDHPFPSDDENRYSGYFREGEEPGFSGYKPSYELRNDGSGRPYSSIVDLRADKIRNFLDIESWDWIAAVEVVKYEELVHRGTSFLVQQIEELTGVKARCQSYPPQERPRRKLPLSFVEWMNEYVDWEAEQFVGYHPIDLDQEEA